MDLRQFEVLRAIAETGSFRAAAGRLRLTQPAISHQLKRLEDELGEILVIRARPKVRLAAAGVHVLAVANRILGEAEELRRQFGTELALERRGALRVTASELGITYLYGDLLERFVASFPRIELALTATETPFDGVKLVQVRAADAAFVAFPIAAPELESLRLGETHHVVIVARDHALARRRAISLAELRRHPFIRYQTGAGSRLVSDALFLANGGYPEVFVESNDTEFVKRMVAMGFGVSIVPCVTITNDTRDRRLRMLTLRGNSLRQEFGLVFRKDARSRTLDAFRAFCQDNKGRIPH